MFPEYERYDAIGLRDLIAAREVSALEVMEQAVHLAEQRDPAINSIVMPMFEAAMNVAGENPVGPLAGVPFLIKDLALVEGVRCSMGGRLWRDFVPDHDAEIVRRYREAGLVIFGKTNTPEVGLAATTESVFLGACHNPWDLTRTTGGSSGGAAAAVAAGILPAAHATDGGGSIRIPASCCGLVGLKPTRARTPLGPDVGEGWGSMATAHVVSRTVRDNAILLDVSHGPAQGDPYLAPHYAGSFIDECGKDPGKLRIALDLRAINDGKVHPECLKGAEQVGKLCESLGHHVETVSFDYDREALGFSNNVLIASNVRNTILRRASAVGVQPTPDNIEAVTQNFVETAANLTGDAYAHAMSVIHGVSRRIERFFESFDLILSPTLLCPPPPLGYMNTNGDLDLYAAHFGEFWGFTSLYNSTGNPAVSLPLHWTGNGLPVGMQFAASFGHEALLYRVACQLEQAQPWRDRRPAIEPAIDPSQR